MSGLSLLQEMTEGLASYPNAGVWRPVPSPLEPLAAELLVEIQQDRPNLLYSFQISGMVVLQNPPKSVAQATYQVLPEVS